ncbi:molecular chaperone DnaJ [Elstera litoralis]|uniref:Molecular chaperone DnaJ n=1 Tax=Elstera litoralis TaxID=552518 RepID=A0A0F3IYF5_9PROT|nr:J domain-containing protein [Elstera litoralis]KJV10624.1 molecular chaperone DnaJ [Elstera litoralis]
MRDPYEVLGVPRTADADAIKSAYRKLAKQFHPDLNPGDKAIETKFKDISAAHDLLSDTEKRARYDRGEIDASGNERPRARRAGGGFGGFGGFGGGFGQKGGTFDFDADDIFDGFRTRSGTASAGTRRGADVSYGLTVDFVTAANGGKRRVTTADGRSLDVNIPPGTEDGNKLRLRGQGQPGFNGGPEGDAFIEIHVDAHPFFVAKGKDIHLEVPVTLQEAILGASVTVPTIDGRVAVKVPRGSNSGSTLRLRGKGIPGKDGARGDQYVKLVVMLPEKLDPELSSFLEKWGPKNPYEVRGKLNGLS